AGWNADIAKLTNQWDDGDTSVTLIDVGRQLDSNVILEDLRQTSPIALAGSTTDFKAVIKNASNEAAESSQATLFVNGSPQTIAIPPIPANESIDIPLRLDFSDAGRQKIRLELPNDLVEADNSRFVIVDVQPSISIVMVDGDPRAVAFQSETDFLAASCRAGRAPWQADVVQSMTEVNFEEVRPNVLVLANVGTIERDDAIRIEKLVNEGMGLIVYTGELIDPESYNSALYKNGTGLLPAELKESAQDEFSGLTIESLGESPLEILTRLSTAVLGRIKPTTIYRVAGYENPDTRVLGTWKGPDPAPALLEKRVGQGRVFLWTVSADRAWSDWPQEPSFVLAMRQTVQYASAQTVNRANVLTGQELQTQLRVTEAPANAKATAPGYDEEFELTVESTEDGPLMEFTDTNRSGFYQFLWDDRDGQKQTDEFAVNVDARESDATRLAEEKLDTFLGDIDWRLLSIGSAEVNVGDQAELWRTGAMIFLGLIGCESIFAAWIGRER
ncbi:MAG: hypothetical protein KDB27_14560, partial [Planctomycetales bacterium]|nr:hypothetical protein [Planctomycetales bacterium]